MPIASDIYAKLKDDHQAMLGLLQRLLKTTGTEAAKRRSLFAEIKLRLMQHTQAEEEVFYAELLQHERARQRIRDSQQEHQRLDDLSDELDRMAPDSPQWLTRARTLKDLVEQHVREEEGQVFALARGILSASQAEDLGRRFTRAKTQVTPAETRHTVGSYTQTTTETAAETARDVGAGVAQAAHAMTETARDVGAGVAQEAQHMAEQAKDKGRSMLQEQKQFLATQLGSLASALQRTAQGLDGQEQQAIAQYTHQAAEGLERFSQTLRDRDIDTLLGQVEDFARRQPAAFVGSAAVLGFLAARFLKSSAERRQAAPAAPSNGHASPPQTTAAGGARPATAEGLAAAPQPVGASAAPGQTTTTTGGGHADGKA